MSRQLVTVLFALALLPCSLAAGEFERLGYGRLVSNDYIGDGRDRWRSGSVSSSRIWGRGWNGSLPNTFGDILELRFNGQIVAPNNLDTPARGDRRYGGALSIGLHTHFERAGLEMSLGGDLVATGPSTGLADFQSEFHRAISTTRASAGTLSNQIADGLHPTVVAEIGQSVSLGSRAVVRPFVETRLGAETLIRAGFDLRIGSVGGEELLVRDPVTGQRYRVVQNSGDGFAFVMGADVAHVADSVFLPSDSGPALLDTRSRARAGLHWQGETRSGFFGVTYLGEEFDGQPGGQVVGSLRLKLDF